MEHSIEKKGEQFVITMTFADTEWAAAIDAAYTREAGRYNVQGFRKGKAPRKVIENQYGEDVFTHPALEALFSKNYAQIMREHSEIKPISYPELDVKMPKDGGVIINAVVDVEPEFELGKYTGLEIKKTNPDIGEKQINDYLAIMADGRARQLAADKNHKIVNGNIAVIDFAGSVDGVEFEGGSAKNHQLEIGSKSFIDTFEDQLVGHKIGDKFDVKVTFPKNYHEKKLAGAAAVFKVEIRNILIKEIPTIDDQFAKEASEFETVAELKADIKNRLEKQAEAEAKHADENSLLRAVVAQTKINVPQKLIDSQLDNIMHDLEYRLAYQGLTLESYADYLNITMDELRAKQKEQAAESVKGRLVFDAIMEKEKISISKEEIDAEVKRVADANGKKPADYTKSKEQMGYIEHELMFGKLVEFLRSKNTFK